MERTDEELVAVAKEDVTGVEVDTEEASKVKEVVVDGRVVVVAGETS